jgi:hypothetical protein
MNNIFTNRKVELKFCTHIQFISTSILPLFYSISSLTKINHKPPPSSPAIPFLVIFYQFEREDSIVHESPYTSLFLYPNNSIITGNKNSRKLEHKLEGFLERLFYAILWLKRLEYFKQN